MPRTLVAITGASSGIGETFARKLAADHDLLLIARRKSRLETLATELLEKFHCQAEVYEADLTNREQLEQVAQRLAADSRLVLLVNNAGFGTRGLFWQNEYTAQEKMHELHVMATLRLTHAALGNLVKRNAGAIVNVASVSAFVRVAGTTSYAATKSWMTVFTEGIHLELQAVRSRVQMQALCPGYTYSGFHQAMGVDRAKLSGEGFWMSSEYVVDASLEGLRRGKLFVIPNWRYRLITAFLSKLPSNLRVGLEKQMIRGRRREFLLTEHGTMRT